MDIKSLLKQSNSWVELKNKLDELPKKEKGNAFELLTKLYFKINPVYEFYDEIWLLNEVPQKVLEFLELPSHDLGIDLIAKCGDEYHPIQCKYHSEKDSSITFKEVSTFISLLEGNGKFTQGYICSTANVTSRNLDKIKTKPINLVLSDRWQELDEEFFYNIRKYFENKKYIPTAYIPREHQIKALKESVNYFTKENNKRGKLIFPCGAGKSLTGFWMTQELKSTSTLIAVPSLSLVKQTLDVYLREIVARGIKAKWLCVCSDEGIGKDDEVLENTESLGIPCQTNPEYIENWLISNKNEHKIIFTTYQSGRIIADVSKKLNISFDLGIFDEAHKTVGLNKKLFSYLLFDENIIVEKRIFMTATERFYSGSKDDIISMDNYDIYGDTFSQMSFKEAIENKLLTDYKVITIDVKKSEIAEFIRSNNLVQLNNKWKNETEARSLASMIALRKAMKTLPIKNAVSFHSSIEKAERNKDLQSYITDTYNYEPIDSFTVSSKISTTKRNDIIREFANSNKSLITNAKCLTEGVDVPNIDCIVFADPRKSKVDIVQALGRALRKKKDKDWGYVILPVIYDDITHEIDNENYNEIIAIVRALATNDERIVEYFKEKGSKSGSMKLEGSSVFDFNFSSELLDADLLTEQLQIKIWEKLSSLNWLTFEEARKIVRGHNFKNNFEWLDYCKSDERPNNLPSAPHNVYKEKGWVSLGDWLGTGSIAPKYFIFKEFNEAREFVRALNLKGQNEWAEYCISGKKPDDLPTAPHNTYKGKGWVSLGDWLGTGAVASVYREFLNFNEAREFVRALNLKSQREWREYCSSGKKPDNITAKPERVYKDKGWINLGDYLGTGTISPRDLIYREFNEAQTFAQSLNFKSKADWIRYSQSGNKPDDLPMYPSKTYKDKGWVSYGEWLGTGVISQYYIEYKEFNEAREFVRGLNLKNSREWAEYCKSGKKPIEIPSTPETKYKDKGWKNWGDWLGTGVLSQFDIVYQEFDDARDFVRGLNLKNSREWDVYCKSGKKPIEIPSKPSEKYKGKGWISLGDWLGTGMVSFRHREYMNFKEARAFVRALNLKNSREWNLYCKSGKKPDNIPVRIEVSYKNKGWTNWPDFLSKRKKK